MLYFLCFVKYVAFPDKGDALFHANQGKVITSASGSLGLLNFDDKCEMTYPNQTLVANEYLDWCSNIASSKENMPWITFSIKNKRMRLTGYSLRNGCCHYACCCTEDGHVIDYACCCRLYSYSLQGSNDNKTWITIHKIEKKQDFYWCKFETFDFPRTQEFQYVRIIQDEEWPGCPKCLQLNQIELYGDTIDGQFYDSFEGDDNEESVSIIGKVRKSNE